jgi:hypothetical protein
MNRTSFLCGNRNELHNTVLRTQRPIIGQQQKKKKKGKKRAAPTSPKKPGENSDAGEG